MLIWSEFSNTISIFLQDYLNYATMMADHEKGNSIAEKSGAAPIQIQGETVSKYDGLGLALL